ncbi:MAG: class C sortase [Clostridiales bacterium]|nr:class C sortase [Clostridiales bacterium]
MRIVRKIVCVVFLAAGIGIFFSPAASSWLQEQESTKVMEAFDEAVETGGAQESTQDDAQESTGLITPSDTLWESIQAYNLQLWENGQAEFRDAWSVTQTPSSVEGLEGEVFGYIEIPAMDAALPLYVGASTSNLAKGAAILGATSLPVGGENTNSVIAAHRGYRGIPFFREIEKLGVGDAVYITNPWGTLGYRVEAIDIIGPYDSDKVMIQAGKDMVTLMTCHPYRSHGKYRYVVYCVRDDSVLGADITPSGGVGDAITASDGNTYPTSQSDIDTERLFRCACGAALIIFFLACLLAGRKKASN